MDCYDDFSAKEPNLNCFYIRKPSWCAISLKMPASFRSLFAHTCTRATAHCMCAYAHTNLRNSALAYGYIKTKTFKIDNIQYERGFLYILGDPGP